MATARHKIFEQVSVLNEGRRERRHIGAGPEGKGRKTFGPPCKKEGKGKTRRKGKYVREPPNKGRKTLELTSLPTQKRRSEKTGQIFDPKDQAPPAEQKASREKASKSRNADSARAGVGGGGGGGGVWFFFFGVGGGCWGWGFFLCGGFLVWGGFLTWDGLRKEGA